MDERHTTNDDLASTRQREEEARARALADEDAARKRRDEEDGRRRQRDFEQQQPQQNQVDPYAAMTEQSRRLDAERQEREHQDRERQDRERRDRQERERRQQHQEEREPQPSGADRDVADATDERIARGAAEDRFRANDRDYSRFYDAADIEERSAQVAAMRAREPAKTQLELELNAAFARSRVGQERSRDDRSGPTHSR